MVREYKISDQLQLDPMKLTQLSELCLQILKIDSETSYFEFEYGCEGIESVCIIYNRNMTETEIEKEQKSKRILREKRKKAKEVRKIKDLDSIEKIAKKYGYIITREDPPLAR